MNAEARRRLSASSIPSSSRNTPTCLPRSTCRIRTAATRSRSPNGRSSPCARRTASSRRKLRELIQFGSDNDAHQREAASLDARAVLGGGPRNDAGRSVPEPEEDFRVPQVALRLWGKVPEQSYLPELAATSQELRDYAAALGAPYCGTQAPFESRDWFEGGARRSRRSRCCRCARITPSACSRSAATTRGGSTRASGTMHLTRLSELASVATARFLPQSLADEHVVARRVRPTIGGHARGRTAARGLSNVIWRRGRRTPATPTCATSRCCKSLAGDVAARQAVAGGTPALSCDAARARTVGQEPCARAVGLAGFLSLRDRSRADRIKDNPCAGLKAPKVVSAVCPRCCRPTRPCSWSRSNRRATSARGARPRAARARLFVGTARVRACRARTRGARPGRGRSARAGARDRKERIVPVGAPRAMRCEAWLALRPTLPAPRCEARCS